MNMTSHAIGDIVNQATRMQIAHGQMNRQWRPTIDNRQLMTDDGSLTTENCVCPLFAARRPTPVQLRNQIVPFGIERVVDE